MQPISIKREIFNVGLRVAAVIGTVILFIIVVNFGYTNLSTISDGSCNIAVMPIEGIILPYSTVDGILTTGDPYVTPSTVRSFLTTVNKEPTIKGVLFEINSPGGTPVAAETIAHDIKAFTLPTVAIIGDVGASGGYMVASGAHTILASSMSQIGSIGVTMSYVENSQKNKEDGLTYVSLSSGKYKDAGSPDKPLTDDERALFEKDLTTIKNDFVNLVATNRNLPVATVSALADGSTMLGQQAVDNKLVDQIGGRDVAKKVFAEMLGLKPEAISFCEYSPKLPIL